jgi:hypothetical protein
MVKSPNIAIHSTKSNSSFFSHCNRIFHCAHIIPSFWLIQLNPRYMPIIIPISQYISYVCCLNSHVCLLKSSCLLVKSHYITMIHDKPISEMRNPTIFHDKTIIYIFITSTYIITSYTSYTLKYHPANPFGDFF